jgi:hypothetical protein
VAAIVSSRPSGDRETLLSHCFLSVPFSLFVYLTNEYVTIFSIAQLQSFSGVFFTPDCCRSLFFVRYSNASKNNILVSNTRPLHSAARRSVSRLEHHILLHCGVAILGPRAKTRCTSVCSMSKVEDFLECRQVIKYNMARRLYNQ